jgi:hypothetical protein
LRQVSDGAAQHLYSAFSGVGDQLSMLDQYSRILRRPRGDWVRHAECVGSKPLTPAKAVTQLQIVTTKTPELGTIGDFFRSVFCLYTPKECTIYDRNRPVASG